MIRGQSMFNIISERNCTAASIPQSLCSCGSLLNIDINSSIIKAAAIFVVNYINNQILKGKENLCMKYELKEIIDAQVIFGEVKNKYLVIFKVSPNDAIFDATVMEKELNSTNLMDAFNIVDQIQRISTYGVTSKCINVYLLRSFCYCKSYHKKRKG